MHVVGKTETILHAKHNYSTREYIKRFLLMPVQKCTQQGFMAIGYSKKMLCSALFACCPPLLGDCPMCYLQLSNVHCAIFPVQRPMCNLHCAGSWVERGWTFEQKSETMVCSSLTACGLTFELNNPRGVAPLWQAVSSKYYPFPLSSVRPVWRWDENGGKWAKALKCECV